MLKITVDLLQKASVNGIALVQALFDFDSQLTDYIIRTHLSIEWCHLLESGLTKSFKIDYII